MSRFEFGHRHAFRFMLGARRLMEGLMAVLDVKFERPKFRIRISIGRRAFLKQPFSALLLYNICPR